MKKGIKCSRCGSVLHTLADCGVGRKKEKRVYGKNDRLANVVWIREAKPNKMFPDWLTQLVRFLHYTEPVPCAHCGKMKKKHWTLLASFRAADLGQFAVQKSEVVLPPLSPICGDHPFYPEIITVKKK